jgi:hypothetical protein
VLRDLRDSPVADRNWDAEMQAIDKQLASISDEQLRARPAAVAAAQQTATPRAAVLPSNAATGGGAWRAYVQAAIAAAGVAGLVLWPYTRSCGPLGIAFVGSAGVVGLLGLWASVGAWRRRSAVAHLIALAALIGAGALAALEILPKVGYAIPTAVHGATWQCDVGAPTAPGLSEPAPQQQPDAVPSPTPSGGPIKL